MYNNITPAFKIKEMGTRSCRITIYTKIRYILDPEEMSFVSQLIYLKDLRDCGCRTAYSSDFQFKSFRLSKNIFYRCVKNLERLKLLERKTVRGFTDYILSEKNYNRLIDIINSTDDVDALISFSEREFILNKRSIDEITDSEILELRIRGDNYKR